MINIEGIGKVLARPVSGIPHHSLMNDTFIIPPSSIGLPQEHHIIMSKIGAPVIDRSRTLQNVIFPNVVIEDELPTEVINPGSFTELVDYEIQQIHNRSIQENLPIVVLYSGGLDSTCVACGFLKAGIAIKIVGSQASIDENPSFYNEVLLNNPLITLDMENPLRFFKRNIKDYLFVTGECGAHIMGTVNWKDKTDIEKRCEKRDYLGIDIFDYPSQYHDIAPELKDKLLKIIDKCPRNIQTSYDAHWWLIFVLKWQYVANRLQMTINEITPNLINFYMSRNFQDWALYNDVTVKCPDNDWKNYKFPIQDYIFAYTHNKESSYDVPPRSSIERTYPKITTFGRYVSANPKKMGYINPFLPEELTKLGFNYFYFDE